MSNPAYSYIQPGEELNIDPVLSSLFPIYPKVFDGIIKSMKEKGFDNSTPIIVWRQRKTIVDGHARYKAAKKLGLEIAIVERDFANKQEALLYAIACQRNRRNITDAEIDRFVSLIDKPQKKGGWKGNRYVSSKGSSDPLLNSADETAKAIGTSPVKVKKVRAIHRHAKRTGDTSQVDAIASGVKSINAAYNDVRSVKEHKPLSNLQAYRARQAAASMPAKPQDYDPRKALGELKRTARDLFADCPKASQGAFINEFYDIFQSIRIHVKSWEPRRPRRRRADDPLTFAGRMALDALAFINGCIKMLKGPCTGMEEMRSLEYMGNIQKTLERLRDAEPDVGRADAPPTLAGEVASDGLPLIKECIEIMNEPIVGRPSSLAHDYMWRLQQMFERLRDFEVNGGLGAPHSDRREPG
jgi:ParB family chromosome partitioning protein